VDQAFPPQAACQALEVPQVQWGLDLNLGQDPSSMGLVPVALEWQTLPQTAAPLVTSGASHPPAAPDPPDLPFPLALEGQTVLADLHLIVDLLGLTDLHTNFWVPALLGVPTDLAPTALVSGLLTGRWAPTDQCTGRHHTSWTVGRCPFFSRTTRSLR